MTTPNPLPTSSYGDDMVILPKQLQIKHYSFLVALMYKSYPNQSSIIGQLTWIDPISLQQLYGFRTQW